MKCKLFIPILLALLFANCNSDTVVTNEQNTIVDVYVAGNVFNGIYKPRAFFIKNNSFSFLTGENEFSEANCVFVSNNDVYIGGTIGSNSLHRACYWKNGVLFFLADNYNFSSFVSDIKVVNGTVFASGNDNGFIVYWKDNNKTILSSTVNDSSTPKIEIQNNDVYVNGHIQDAIGRKPVYWKNGVLNILSSDSGFTFDIKVKNNDVYVLGNIYDVNFNPIQIYWKNNIENIVPDSADLSSIAISDTNDVYVCGMDLFYTSAYWKNGIKTIVNQNTGVMLNDIKILDNLIFSCGFTNVPVYSMINLNGVTNFGTVENTRPNSIFVVKKQ